MSIINKYAGINVNRFMVTIYVCVKIVHFPFLPTHTALGKKASEQN